MNTDFEKIKIGFYRNNSTKEIYYVYSISKDNMVSAIRQSINKFMFDNLIKTSSYTFNKNYTLIDEQKNFCLRIDKYGNYFIDETKNMKVFFEKLIWFDWLFIIISILLLLPALIYVYGTLIFGDIGFSGKQEFIVILMAGAWVMVVPVYLPLRSEVKRK